MPRAARERLILDVAGQVFADSGYHSASMDEIAELAGVSKPMIYAYFDSKEGLYVAYVSLMGRELLDRLVGAVPRDEPPADRLRARITEFLSFVEENRNGWTVLFSEAIASRPLENEVAQLRRQIAEAVQRMVQASIPAHGESFEPATEGIAHAIVGAGESLANWWLENPGVEREQVADWYVAMVQSAVPAMLKSGAAARRPA
jgi:AcrR family transcriptional regulator